jgi:hypothetical protein
MSRRTAAIRYATRVIDSLCADDDGALQAAREAVERLSFEPEKLAVLEARTESQRFRAQLARAVGSEGQG